jgi:hypothetical protein
MPKMRKSLQQQKRTQSAYRNGSCTRYQKVTVYLLLNLRLNDYYLVRLFFKPPITHWAKRRGMDRPSKFKLSAKICDWAFFD